MLLFRLPENPKFEQKTRDVEVADDFTQFTVDNMDPPGYEDSVVIKHLASCKGSMSTVKYQDALREYEWAIQKESAQSLHMLSKLSQLKVDRSKLGQIFKDMCDSRSALELQTLELKTELKNLKFILKQEQDKHSNTTMLYNKTCEQLNTMEAQYNAEIEKRQKVELIMSNLELEMKMLVSSMKQLEEDHKETQRMLAQESSARAFQEMLLNNHLQRQKESEEENRRTLKESKEANDREKELLQENRNLQEQVTSLKMKLEWAHATRNQQGEGQQSEEIETLREKLEDTRRELKLNEEALAQTVLQYNGQVNALRAECAVATAKLEHEKQAREKLEVEAESARAQLVATLQDLERSRAMRADLERALQRERDDSKREQEKHTCEEASQRESIHSLTQQLSVAEGRVRNLEQELHQSKLSLAEKSLLLERVQLEYSQAQARLVELESTLKAEREQGQRATAQHEIVKKQLAQVQEEVPFLCQRLEESQNVHDHFSELLAKLRNGCEERVTVAEDKSKEMIAQNAKLQEELKRQEKETKEQETAVRRLRQELADMLKKLTVCEASIEVNQQHRTDLKEQNQRLQRDNERLKEKLQDSERRCIEAERLTKDGKEHNAITTSQKLQDVMSPPAGTDKATKQLEEALKINSLSLVQVEAEKKKVKRISEQKTTVDIRLDQEIKRNSDLHKEMYRLKTLVKITKKKLREQEKAEFALHSKGLPVKTDQRLSGLKSKLEELSVQLDEETGKCKRLERVNEDLKEKLSNYKDLVKRHKQLERYKSQLEDKVASLQRQMKSEMMDRSQAEQYRREIVEQAQKEVRQKLEEVNLFLQNQAASHDALEQMKAANEASLRTQMEQRLQELEKELSALRSSHQDALSQRHSMQAELERFRELYAEELRLRKGLAAKLERSNERLTEAHTRLLTERQHSMSLISSGIANGSLSRPDLEVGAFGAMLGHPNKKMALESSGGSILGPGGDMQGSKVETYLAQMQNDLEKKISKELAHVMVEQDGSPCMSSGGSGTGSQKSPAGDQDAINRATQQYLEVLKKNYLL
ncbi:ankyrin repeat domain-containing protein 26-like [Arapaima gigas]